MCAGVSRAESRQQWQELLWFGMQMNPIHSCKDGCGHSHAQSNCTQIDRSMQTHAWKHTLKHPPSYTQIHKCADSEGIYTGLHAHICTLILTLSLTHWHTHTHTGSYTDAYFICICQHLSDCTMPPSTHPSFFPPFSHSVPQELPPKQVLADFCSLR